MAAENGAVSVVKTLVAGKCDVMFANPGTTEMLVVDALDRCEGMRAILCLHETVCTGAADGYGRMAGRPACTLLHLGVGLANGSANLHNARRAGTPIVNLVGDMASWHVAKDPLLASDIEGLAAFTACSYAPPTGDPDALAGAVADALVACRDYRAGESRVATVALGHDATRDALKEAWAAPPQLATLNWDGKETPSLFEQSIRVHNERYDGNDAIPKHVRACAAALKDTKAALFVGGAGLWDEDALAACGAIAAATGCDLVVENAFARVDRGGDRPQFTRVPYFPKDALTYLAKFETVVFVGARRPVAMFGYDDGVSDLVATDGQKVLEIDAMDVPGALRYLAGALGDAPPPPPPKPAKAAKLPKGKLSAYKLCQALAATQPLDAVVVDESLTSGGSYWDLSLNCAPFSHLTLTGGSIGIGPPLAVGCAVACPGRRVIDFQADGSGLYSTPAFWTMASENLDVTILICKNDVYQILKVEQQKQNLPQTKPNAKRLTDLRGPSVDWVALAKAYGIPATSVATGEALVEALQTSFTTPGPYLVEACF